MTDYEITYGDWSSDVCTSDIINSLNPYNNEQKNPYYI